MQQEHCLSSPCYEGVATVRLDQGDDERFEPNFVKVDEVCTQAGSITIR